MRDPVLGTPPPGNDPMTAIKWIIGALQKIARATRTSLEYILDDYETTGTLTESRTFDVDAATLDQVRQVLGTILLDSKKRGTKAKT